MYINLWVILLLWELNLLKSRDLNMVLCLKAYLKVFVVKREESYNFFGVDVFEIYTKL